ncbi:MAG: deoxyhypusine synthase family protein [Chloroflexi bacterium]|nr:deoxyhypusine synthase family protein [Chloroflexota bacterium]
MRPGDSASDLLRKMAGTAFQARNLGRAAEIWGQMLAGKTTIIFALSGALVPAGMRKLLVYLIQHRYIDCLVSTGAQLFHDLNETLGRPHYQGHPEMDDAALRQQRVVRMYDVLADDRGQDASERFIKAFAEQLPDQPFTTRAFLYRLGQHLREHAGDEGILTAAAAAGIPVFCPALGDSILGTALAWARYEGKSQLQIDIVQDLLETSRLVEQTERQGGRTGLVIVGGGTPRNYAQQSATLGYMAGEDLWYKTHLYAIQITTDVPQWGGLSGATFEESKSWGKFDLAEAQTVHVYCEATIALPLLATAVAERHQDSVGGRSRPIFQLEGEFSLSWSG